MRGRTARWLVGTCAASAALFIFSPASAQTVVVSTDTTGPVVVPDGSGFANSARIEVDWTGVDFPDLPPIVSAVYGSGGVTFFLNRATGVIRADGLDIAYGVEIVGDIGDFQNHGEIYGGDGVHLGGNVATFTNTGDIAAYNFGVSILGSVGTVNNSGTIDGFYGLNASNVDNLINSGTISGGNHIGLLLGSAGHIENTGTFSSNYTGLLVSNDLGSFNNRGTLSASNIGLLVNGRTGSFVNSGSVISEALYHSDFGVGAMFVGGVDNFVNTGRIYGYSAGVLIGLDEYEDPGSTDPSRIFNSGIIETDPCGCGFLGLGFTAGSLNNTGVIRSGIGVGVLPHGTTGVEITNSGTIEGTEPVLSIPVLGDLTMALMFDTINPYNPVDNNEGTPRDDVLRLLPGSRLLGMADFAAGDDTLDLRDYQGSSIQIYYNLERVLAGNSLTMDGTVTTGSGIVITVDDTAMKTAGAVQFGEFSGALHSGIANALGARTGAAGGPLTMNYAPSPASRAEQAATGLALSADADRRVWGGSFGSLSADGSVGNAWSQALGGLVAGSHVAVGNNTTLGGVVSIGAARYATPADGHVITSTLGAVGIYGETELDAGTLDFALLGGASVNHSAREVSGVFGVQSAVSDYASWFISPQVGFSVPVLTLAGFDSEAGFKLRYVGGAVGAHDETGSVMNLSVPTQLVSVLDARAELTTSAIVGNNGHGDVTLSTTLGGLAQANLGAADFAFGVLGEFGGIPLVSSAPGMLAVGAYAGAALAAPIGNAVDLTISAGGEMRSDEVAAVSASAKLAGSF
jgi:hypothetical protein